MHNILSRQDMILGGVFIDLFYSKFVFIIWMTNAFKFVLSNDEVYDKYT